MNERIRQLAEQAGSTHKQNLGVYQFYTDELEKFAELIVKECAKVAWYHTPDTEELEYSHLIEDKILEHFGVK
jgi:hypothetical protein